MSSLDTTSDISPHPLVIHQPEQGYRYSIDSFLLASFVTMKKNDKVIDLGSGVGVIGLILAARYLTCSVWGIEIQERLFRFAERNRRENELGDRMTNILGDYRRLGDLVTGMSFDIVVSNPPYRPPGTGRRSSDDERTIARHEITGGIADVVTAAKSALKPKGRLFLILPSWRIVDVMTLLRSSGLEPKRIRFVHAFEGRDAQLVMVEARQGSGIELTVMPPLIIWKVPGAYTDEVGPMVDPVRVNTY